MEEKFIRVPYSVLQDDNINSTDKIILSTIFGFANLGSADTCTVSVSRIAKITNISRETVRVSECRLEDMGYITRDYQDCERKIILRVPNPLALPRTLAPLPNFLVNVLKIWHI